MSNTLFALADTRTVSAFLLIGELRRRIMTAQTWRDAAGDHWLGVAAQQTWVGIAGAGPGIIYHPATAAEAPASLRTGLPRNKTPQREDFELLDWLRLGPQMTRLLWGIHLGVLEQRVWAPEFGYDDLAARVWGRDQNQWPHHWRRDLRRLLLSLTWLHRAEDVADAQPTFGPDTVIAYQVTIDGQRLTDPGGHDPRNARIQVFVGPALLGCLEQLAKTEPNGEKTYAQMQSRQVLRQVGRSGRLQRVFLPAIFPEDTALELSPGQQRLLQSLFREITRAKRSPRKTSQDTSEPEIVMGAVVRSYSGRGVIPCPALGGPLGHIAFNGNGRRSGMGYRLNAKGWLTRCGYAENEAANFLGDLRSLADDLGLIVVGVTREGVVGLDTLEAWASARATDARLAATDARVFVAEGYQSSWAACFGWPSTPVVSSVDADRQRLVELVAALKLSKREIARRLRLDHSFFSRILAGKKNCPADLVSRVETLLAKGAPSTGRAGGSFGARRAR